MRIALLEHFSSLPEGTADAELVAAGLAMRDAVGADLKRLSSVEVTIVARRRQLGAALRGSEAVLVIAPEQGGILGRLCRRVERAGCLLLGSASSVVRLAGDKLWTARRLAAAGVTTPRTEAVPFAEGRRLRELEAPFVLKPRDGCGGRGVVVVRRAREVAGALRHVRRATHRPDFLVQEHIAGAAASVSFLAGSRLLDLGLNRQRLRPGRALVYLGGETFWPHPRAAEAVAAARAAIAVLAAAGAPLRGYVGVDLVLGQRGVTVIEINPRLTTSYVGLRLSIRENLAGLILRAASGGTLPESVTPIGRRRFGAGGETRSAWRPISVGTSAAST